MPKEVIECLFIPDPATKTGEWWLCQPHGAVPMQLSPSYTDGHAGGDVAPASSSSSLRLPQVAVIAQVGLPQAGCPVAGGVGRVAVCVDLHLQGGHQAVVLLVHAQGGREANHPGPDDGHAHGSGSLQGEKCLKGSARAGELLGQAGASQEGGHQLCCWNIAELLLGHLFTFLVEPPKSSSTLACADQALKSRMRGCVVCHGGRATFLHCSQPLRLGWHPWLYPWARCSRWQAEKQQLSYTQLCSSTWQKELWLLRALQQHGTEWHSHRHPLLPPTSQHAEDEQLGRGGSTHPLTLSPTGQCEPSVPRDPALLPGAPNSPQLLAQAGDERGGHR